ncbi:hypothetical protein [Actinoplanes friuliensis]|uniref:hypothetical protein n=1 Tax=Actinoplanes friuliensis TaxID=196914 RepID=UPI0011DCABF6|nr:hypothetical protein [Actinoplanes friuliensis]
MSDGFFTPGGMTPWPAYNTPRIWAMVANEDNPESWQQVAALSSMAGLIHDQKSRLEASKQKLIDAWPPGDSKAAAAFVRMIDYVLLNMEEDRKTADKNAAALGRVLGELQQAKKDIAPLYQSYLEKSDDWVPGWWDNAEEELDGQARARMRQAEQVIAKPENAITPPEVYEFAPRKFVDRPVGGSDETEGGRGSGVSRGGTGVADFQVPHNPPPTLPGFAGPDAPGNGFGSTDQPAPPPAGPGLAGVITPPVTSGSPVAPIQPSAPGGLPASQPGQGLVIGGGIGGGFAGGSAGSARGGFSPFGVGPQRGGAGAVRGGGASATKPATPSWLPPPSGQPARGGAATGRRSNSSPMLPATGARRPDEDQEGGMTFDPDNPWATAEGVAPVIEPSRKVHRHDPGPGVIGWHE